MPMRLVLSFIAPRMQRFKVTSRQRIVRTTNGLRTHECISDKSRATQVQYIKIHLPNTLCISKSSILWDLQLAR